MFCSFCQYEKRRQVAAQNSFGDYACDRHIAELWQLEFVKRSKEVTL